MREILQISIRYFCTVIYQITKKSMIEKNLLLKGKLPCGIVRQYLKERRF